MNQSLPPFPKPTVRWKSAWHIGLEIGTHTTAKCRAPPQPRVPNPIPHNAYFRGKR